MAKESSKKQIILSYWRGTGIERVGRLEIRAIQAELRRRLGDAGGGSPSYVAAVLREAGARVDYEDRYLEPLMDEPYASRLKGQLHFGDLASAEESIRKLSAIYDEYHALQDRIGMRLVRSIVLKGKERAQSLAANPRVSGGKKREKQEIATWFRVWLETPEIFLDWLGLRKQSEEFRCLFPTVLNEGEFERQHSQSPTE